MFLKGNVRLDLKCELKWPLGGAHFNCISESFNGFAIQELSEYLDSLSHYFVRVTQKADSFRRETLQKANVSV